MKIFISTHLKRFATMTALIVLTITVKGQKLDSLIDRTPIDTSSANMNMDAVYNRPFLSTDKMPVALGGYLEANSMYSTEDGVTEGLSFQARRLTIFMSASISKRIKFLSEMEFEDGTKEIGIEFAAMDISLHSLLNLRGGIVMNPIGSFNQNHDGPKWEFVERPDVAVNMLPATWSNAGFGIFGKGYSGNWVVGYEAYLTNGFDNSIIDNKENKTFLPSTKENHERFEENNSGKPLVTGKLAIKNRKIGEVGLSYMGGVYNKFETDGVVLDSQRRLDVFAIDLSSTIKKTNTFIVGEFVFATIDVPETYTQQYGNQQYGAYLDIVQPIVKRKILDWNNATVNIAARFDYVDWNKGTFNETGENIGDEIIAITPAISFRPSSQTVIRANYKYQWQTDILGNPPAKKASWIIGFSTYF